MEEFSRPFTAFSAVDAHYEYKVMPQGAKNAANHFASLVETAFGHLRDNKLQKMMVYQDDILNFSDDLEQHLLLQQIIYNTMREYRLIFKIVKAHLNYKTQRVLGHILTKNGRLPDPSLIKSICDLVKPKNLVGIQSLLGLAQVAREYIPALATLIEPIQALSKKGIDVEKAWGENQDKAFETLKTILTTQPVLLIADMYKPFRLHVDACRVGKGIGAILLQLNEKSVFQPVAYWSRALTPAERNYSATELECTALHDTILHWQVYLLNGIEFEAIVDHYALVYMVTKAGGAEAQQRLLRLCLDLQQFTFKVIHRSGIHHLDADAVSRLLGKDDQPYVRTANELRDDTKPLSSEEKQYLKTKYNFDSEKVIKIIDIARHDMEEAKAQAQHRATSIVNNIKVNAIKITSINSLDPFDKKIRAIIRAHEKEQLQHRAQIEESYANTTVKTFDMEEHSRPTEPITIINTVTTHDVETEYKEDLEWIKRQQEGWLLDKRKFKRLPQISNKTLRKFLEETKVQHRTKSRIQEELLNRDIAKSQIKSLRTKTLHTMNLQNPQEPETKSELQSRERRSIIGKFQTCSDTQLYDYIRSIGETNSWKTEQKDTLIHQNVMTTRPTNKRTEQQLIEKPKRKYAKSKKEPLEKVTEMAGTVTEPIVPTIETEKKKQLKTEAAQINPTIIQVNEEKEQFSDNVEIVKETLPTAQHNTEFRVDPILMEKLLKEMVRTKVSKTERDKALQEKAARDHSQLRTEERVAMEERRRLIFARKADAKKRKDLRSKEREMGLPRSKLTNHTTDLEIEAQDYEENRTLEAYDHLVNQMYREPDTEKLYEIINVYCEKSTGTYMSTAIEVQPTDTQPNLNEDNKVTRQINGTNGTNELVNLMQTGRTHKSQLEWPKTEKEWIERQTQDEWCQKMMEKLTTLDAKISSSQTDTEMEDYFYRAQLEGGLGALFRRTHIMVHQKHLNTEINVLRKIDQIVVPKSVQDACLHLLHDQVGHPGRQRTIDTIRQNYTWIGLNEDVRGHIRNCRFCKLRKTDTFRAKVPIQPYQLMLKPFDRVHADLAGPFAATKTGNVYILIIKDAMTKFIIITPLENKEGVTITEAFTKQILPHYGPPRMLITDKGTDFVNKDLKRWCRNLGTIKKNTTPANPRSDGLAENAVRTVKDMLVSYINVYHNDWDTYLPIMQYDYNTTVNVATGYEPFFLMFGRTSNRSCVIADTIEDIAEPHSQVSEYGERFAEVMHWVWNNNAERVVSNSKEMLEKQHPKTHLIFKEYAVGDFFYLKRIPKRFYIDEKDEIRYKLNAKLQYRWTGPYIVTKKVSPVLYESDIHNKRKMVHAVNMRPF